MAITSNAILCPRCGEPLNRALYHGKICYRCKNGHGTAMTLAAIRTLCGNTRFVSSLWLLATHAEVESPLACPVCRKKMKRIVLPLDGKALVLDICCNCQEIWFDPDELESLPQPPPPPEAEMPQRAKEILADFKVKQAEKDISQSCYSGHIPDKNWKVLVSILGFPVEKESPAVHTRPWITWLLVFVCIAVFACTVTDLHSAAAAWGLIPVEKWRYGGLTFLSSMFLHGGFGHIIGNLYFLMIFGDNVEDFFGKRNYALLILSSGLAAGILHVLFNPLSPVPCVGASGFISGVIAAYAFCFPKVKISFFLRFLWIGIPAWAAFGLWIVFQTVMAYATRSNDGSGVAYMAHIGGAIPGILFALYLRFSTSRKAGDLAKKLDDYSKSY